MASPQLTRLLTGPAAALILSGILLVALFLLTEAAQKAQGYGQLYTILLIVNVVGITALLVLIATNLFRLFNQFRSGVLGSKMTLRLLAIYALLAVVPLSVVYYFSVQFLNKGIDSWFDVKVERALDDALLVGRTSMEALKASLVDVVHDEADRIGETQSQLEVIRLLDELRVQGDYSEISMFTQAGRIIASSSIESTTLIPETPNENILNTIGKGQDHSAIEPVDDEGNLRIRVVVPVYSRQVSSPLRVLQVFQLLPIRYSKLDRSIEKASEEYRRLLFLRAPLKFNFVLTLTLITLMTAMIALWAAIYSARYLVAPLRDLAEGTRAVAAGNYQKQIPVTSSDELGVLVQSFNDMTRRVSKAQGEANQSQREAELQRTWLETVLAHLSSGVMAFDRRRKLLTVNDAASEILILDRKRSHSLGPEGLAREYPHTEPLMRAIGESMRADQAEWSTEINLSGRRGRQTLICRVTRLPVTGSRGGGYVVVFDDVTELIRAQRDAAWGEVARRLAHEIKNPLTPIALSAERIRHKYLDKFEDANDRDTLDRATRTIAQQVESMKQMVNAFSSYAQPMKMRSTQFDLNRLIQDVVELHRRPDDQVSVTLTLAADLPRLSGDPDRVRQVLNNLIINTLDALHETDNGIITISTRNTHASNPTVGTDSWDASVVQTALIEVEVADNGPGFPDNIVDRVFEPYVTTKAKGTGLGLAIVKRIIDEHAGHIWAENIDGGGARITMQFPHETGSITVKPEATTSDTPSSDTNTAHTRDQHEGHVEGHNADSQTELAAASQKPAMPKAKLT